MTVEAIKEAIVELPGDVRRQLSLWLNTLDSELAYDDWDREMAQDFSAGGRGAHLLDQVRADIASGKFLAVDKLCDDVGQKPR